MNYSDAFLFGVPPLLQSARPEEVDSQAASWMHAMKESLVGHFNGLFEQDSGNSSRGKSGNLLLGIRHSGG